MLSITQTQQSPHLEDGGDELWSSVDDILRSDLSGLKLEVSAEEQGKNGGHPGWWGWEEEESVAGALQDAGCCPLPPSHRPGIQAVAMM